MSNEERALLEKVNLFLIDFLTDPKASLESRIDAANSLKRQVDDELQAERKFIKKEC